MTSRFTRVKASQLFFLPNPKTIMCAHWRVNVREVRNVNNKVVVNGRFEFGFDDKVFVRVG